jgi:hypothetical protein
MTKSRTDYLQDLTEIRAIMQRSTRFLSLSGWAGIVAGLVAAGGSYVAKEFVGFNPKSFTYVFQGSGLHLLLLALGVFISALAFALFFSWRNARKKGEVLWNATSRKLLQFISFPMFVGGILLWIFYANGLAGLLLPVSLIFYGLALFSASPFTLSEVRFLGLVQVIMGLTNLILPEEGWFFWIMGFGIAHLVYGIYMYFRYER